MKKGFIILSIMVLSLIVSFAVANADDIPAHVLNATYKMNTYIKELREVKQKMQEQGYYDAPINGNYNNKTVECVKRFQKDHGLEETGQIDKAFLDALYMIKAIATPTVRATYTPKPTAIVTVKPTTKPTVKSTSKPTAKPIASATLKPTASPISSSSGISYGDTMDKWVKSSDGVLEASLVSIDTSYYPKIEIKLEYRIDSTTSASGVWQYDGSQAISSYIANHPEYKNRKVTLNASIASITAYREGIQYSIRIQINISGGSTDYFNAGINLWEEFPNDFIDYDAFHIADGLKMYKQYLYDSSSFRIDSDATMGYSSNNNNIIYYKVSIAGKNRLGGYVSNDVGIVYNEKTSKIDVINLKDIEYIVKQGANPGAALWNEATNMLHLNTRIWKRLIEKAM